MENKDEETEKQLLENTSTRDVMRHDDFENTANAIGPGSESEEGASQDGRTDRVYGGIDLDSKNGVIRFGDMDNSTMEITEEGEKNLTGNADKTNTGPVDVTTHGPDDYASADQVPVPKAQEQARQQTDESQWDADKDERALESDGREQEDDMDQVSQTGTDTEHQPTY